MNKVLFTALAAIILSIQFSCTAQNKLTKLDVEGQLKAHNKAVRLLGNLWMRDPYITLATDGFYYLSFTQQNNVFPDSIASIQFFRSNNLIDWEDLGIQWRINESGWGKSLLENYQKAVAKNAKQLPEEPNRVVTDPSSGSLINTKLQSGPKPPMIWAPELHFVNGKWVILTTTNQQSANLFTSENSVLQSPFNEPFGSQFGHRHDPSLFMDGETPWLVYACTKIIKLKKDFSGFDGTEITLQPSNRKLGHEGAFIKKFGGRYILFGTAWSHDTLRHGTYNLYYTVSDSLTSGYGERKFAGRFLGHGTIFQDKEGHWWCTAFANGDYLSPDDVKKNNVNPAKATTINKQGLTLVPINIGWANGTFFFKVLDPDYSSPGQEELQKF